MRVREIMEKLELFLVAGASGVDREAYSVYIGDMLSWVMSNAQQGNIWITIQSHLNIVAVASLTGVSCIIVAEGCIVEKDTVDKANEEGIPIFASDLSSYQIARKLIELGIE